MSEMLDSEKSFLKVFTSLDYLKLVNRSPNICLIGDFLKFSIYHDNNVFSKIDGNLGEATKVLTQLMDPSEHTFRLSVIAKVAKDPELEQVTSPPSDHCGGKIKSNGLIPNGQIRATLFINDLRDECWFAEEKPIKDKILSIRDLNLAHVDLIENAHCVGLMSTRFGDNIDFVDDFVNLLQNKQIKLNNNAGTPPLFFINANIHQPNKQYGFDPDHTKRAVSTYQLLGEYCNTQKGSLWISVSNEELSALTQLREPESRKILDEHEWQDAAQELATKIHANIVYHDRKRVALFNSGNILTVNAPEFIKSSNKYDDIVLHRAGDALNAGLLLALTTRLCLQQWNNAYNNQTNFTSNPELIPTPLPEPPKQCNIDDKDCIHFAHVVAISRLIKLQKGLGDGKLVPPPTRFEVYNLITDNNPPNITSVKQLENITTTDDLEVARNIHKIAFSNIPKMAETLKELISSQSCPPLLRLQAITGLRHRIYYNKPTPTMTHSKKHRNVILWDLDNTLIPSKEDYLHSIWVGVQELPSLSGALSTYTIKSQKDLRAKAIKLTKRLYALHDHFVTKTSGRFCDFRRVWNSEEFYATFLGIWLNPNWCKEFVKNPNSNTFPASVDWEELKIEIDKSMENPGLSNDFKKSYNACYNSEISVFDHSIEVMSTLKLFGFDQYIVTEGDDKSQLWKWCQSQLSDVIDGENVLTSFRAGEEAANLIELNDIIKKLEGAPGKKKIVEALKHIQRILRKFQDKSLRDFYIIVLRAISTIPEAAKTFLGLIGPAHIPIKDPFNCVMIGDTFNKDIRPIKEIKANVKTIMVCIMRDRFRDQVTKYMKDAKTSVLPDHIIPTLLMVQDQILLSNYSNNWKPIKHLQLNIEAFDFIVSEANVRALLEAAHEKIWGIERIINDLLFENSLKGDGKLLSFLLEISFKENETKVLREYSHDAVKKIQIKADDFIVLHKKIDKLMRRMVKRPDVGILREAFSLLGEVGSDMTQKWLIKTIQDPNKRNILRPCIDTLIEAFRSINRRVGVPLNENVAIVNPKRVTDNKENIIADETPI